MVNPSQEEALKVAERFNIDIQDLRAPLDVEETSRIDVEDDYTLILVDIPTQEERNNKSYYVTIPLGIIVTDEGSRNYLPREHQPYGRLPQSPCT